MQREKCVICGNNQLKVFLEIPKMPCFMGVVDLPVCGLVSEMIFSECQNCKNVQLKKLLDLDVVYSNNHNTEIVGELWKNHYIKFIEFVGERFRNKVILEVGDPSAKIAKLEKTHKKWIIVEKNPDVNSHESVQFIKAYFEEDFDLDFEIDVIIHSHLFEHLYEPVIFLNKCNQILKNGGDMFFSIPDLRHFLNGDFLPNSILQFEHTYFIDVDYVKHLCNLTGFEYISHSKYSNHSVFIHLRKSNNNIKTNINHSVISHRFIEKYDKLLKNVEMINKKIENHKNVYLYGAHVTSQSYIFNGLDFTNIKGLIDGSSQKINKYLYGTNLKTFEPESISDMDEVCVICSHMGIYVDEISINLRKINPEVVLI